MRAHGTTAPPLKVSLRLLGRIRRDAEERYPSECCGILLGPGKRGGLVTRVAPVENIQDRMHAENPGEYRRTSRRAYLMDPDQQLRILREAEKTGFEIRAFYHSHPDEGAYFSQTDRRLATSPWGEPSYPEAAFVVLSVRERCVRAARQFRWDPKRRGFREASFPMTVKGRGSASPNPRRRPPAAPASRRGSSR